MNNMSIWIILTVIYLLAATGCLGGVVAMVIGCSVNAKPRQTLWMGYAAAAIGLLLLITWAVTGERLSFWIVVPIVSLFGGLGAVIQSLCTRSCRRRSRYNRCRKYQHCLGRLRFVR